MSNDNPTKWLPLMTLAVGTALFVLSATGCASKPKQPPKTITDFLKQPRPQ